MAHRRLPGRDGADATAWRGRTEPSQAAVPAPPTRGALGRICGAVEPAAAQGSLATPASSAPAPRPWQHTAKWVASGAAVVALGLGWWNTPAIRANNHDFNKNPTCTAGSTSSYCRISRARPDTAQTWAIIGGSVALVAAGTAVWLWLTDPSQPAASEHAGLGFSCVPALAGRFLPGQILDSNSGDIHEAQDTTAFLVFALLATSGCVDRIQHHPRCISNE